jgi:hypothetical protein
VRMQRKAIVKADEEVFADGIDGGHGTADHPSESIRPRVRYPLTGDGRSQ